MTTDEAGSPLLEVTDLAVSFPGEEGRVQAVRGVSYSVRKGEVLAIVGESGSGKSVSSLAVMGLLPDQARTTGSIKLNGQELVGRSDKEMSKIRGKTISMVFQDPLTALTPVYPIGDQIAEALLVHGDGMSKEAAGKRAIELLELVGIPDAETRAKGFPHEFSGGMRQRVVIAIAIANDPDLIICDEPTTALDVTVQAQILDLLIKAKDVTGAGIVMITHDLGVVAGFADRTMVMYAGRAVENAPVNELYGEPRMPYTLGLIGSIPRLDAPMGSRLVPIPGVPPDMSKLGVGCPFAPRCPLVIDECLTTEPSLISVGPGHDAACIRTDEVEGKSAAEVYKVAHESGVAHAVVAGDGATVLEVSGLSKTYALTKGIVFRRKMGEVKAVDKISFEIKRGETFGLVGESGCGKSTTLTQLLELKSPEAGTIKILGNDVATMTKQQKRDVRRNMQVVFQDPVASLDPRLPIFDVLAEPLRLDGWSKDKVTARVFELLDTVGMRTEHASRYPADFSGGQKQRIGIARALALKPELLVLDEPVSALDVSIQAGVINLLQDLQNELGLSYLFVSHDLSVVKHLAHRVAVMYRGQIVEMGETEPLFENPQHEYTRALLSAIPIPDPAVKRPTAFAAVVADPSPI